MRRGLSVLVSLVLGLLLAVQPMLSVGSENALLLPLLYDTPESDQIKDNGLPWWERTSMDLDRNNVFDQLDDMILSRHVVDVFVDYDHAPTEEDLMMLRELGLSTDYVEPYVFAVGVNGVPVSRIPVITRLPGVVMVEPKMEPTLYLEYATPNAKARESADYSPVAWDLGYSGKGVNIAIVDTGIDDVHPGLNGKFIAGVDFSTAGRDLRGIENPDDTSGHGTTCAGISTGTGAPDGVHMGSAPNASLVDVRIGTGLGFAPSEIIRPGDDPRDATLKGIRWVGDHANENWPAAPAENMGIDILSLSWGIALHDPRAYDSDGSDVYSRALDDVVKSDGVFVVNAAGNDGPDNTGLHGCASASYTIVVAASDDTNTVTRDDDEIAGYSSRGPRMNDNDGNPYDELIPTLAASGTDIWSTNYGDSLLPMNQNIGDGYADKGSGTSYATPLVAGVLAMMIEANQNLTPLVAREMLQATAERKGEPEFPELDPFWNGDWGYGLVDAYSAVKLAEITPSMLDLDTNIQCYIMDTIEADGRYSVSGMAWHRDGQISSVEYRIGEGKWRKATPTSEDDNNSWSNWNIQLARGEGPVANETLEVRALAGDDHGLVDWVSGHEMGIHTAMSDEDQGKFSIGGNIGLFVAVIAVAIVGYGMWRALKDKNKKEPVPMPAVEETSRPETP